MTTVSKFNLILCVTIAYLLTSSITDCVSQTIFDLPYTPEHAIFYDYDLDGDNDILVGCISDTVVILQNTGFGNLERIDLPLTSGVIFKLDLMDTDEYPDLVTGYYYYKNDGNGGFEESCIPIPHSHEHVRFVDVKDMDNNGYPDIIYYAFLQPYGWGIIYNNGNNNFDDDFIHQSESVEYPNIDFLNYDNSPDILLSSSSTHPGNYIAYNYGPGYIFDTLCDHSEAWVYNYIIDIDSDGDDDILFSKFSLSLIGKYLFYENMGNENFVEIGLIDKKGGVRIDVVSDFDGDGYQDLACISRNNSGSSTDSIYILKNTQNNSFMLLDQVYIGEAGSMTEHIYSGDLNGDGLGELLVTGYMNPTGSHVRILWNDGTGHFVDTNTVLTKIQTHHKYSISASPNPFETETTIKMLAEETTPAELLVYNLRGKLITNSIHNLQGGKINSIKWDGTNNKGKSCPPGTYIASLRINNESATSVKIIKTGL